MTFDSRKFQVNGITVEWGKTLAEASSILHGIDQFKAFGGWPNTRYKCNEILGLKATEVNIRAPFEDRPVLQVSYGLQPLPIKFWEKLHHPYLNHLKRIFGQPEKNSMDYNLAGYKKEYQYGAVVYNAKWRIDDIRIALSVYGGLRNDESGTTAAGLYFDWINESKAASSFKVIKTSIERVLSEKLSNEIEIENFYLDVKQRPFYVADYTLEDPDIALKQSSLRADQLALYKRELYQTPEFIASRLSQNQIALYFIPKLDKWFVSTHFDTVPFSPAEKAVISFIDVQPARGSGYYAVEVKELRITDNRKSNALSLFVRALELKTGMKVNRIMQYDD
jgi:hypothetical protein